MKLNLPKRISLLSYLPKEGKFETLIVIKDIKNKIEITQDEITEYEIKSVENSIFWNDAGATSEIEVAFTELEKLEISKTLKKLSEEEKLRMEDVELYEMFV